MIKHEISPVYTAESRVLILGIFPSVKSRAAGFFYHHPQNRFWKMIGRLAGAQVPTSIEEKKQLLWQSKIAVWDVIQSCDITGSSDSSIKNVIASDLAVILDVAQIKGIYANGNKAYELYYKYQYPKMKRDIVKLPSTSPANAAYSVERLWEEWKQIRDDMEDI